DDFMRLDLEVRAHFSHRRERGEWRIEPYVRVLNALSRRDALFYTFQPWRDPEARPLAERSLLPVVGVTWVF
ncbi:MAG: hypothetical protein OEZ37_02110, partial [Gemmatimonadota bacterium]|nr:hypothetical protein [Gemmatimonadota bacterium]